MLATIFSTFRRAAPVHMERKQNETSAPAASPTALACRTILASSVIDTRWASHQCVWFQRVTKAAFCESFTFLSVRDFFRFGITCKTAQALCSDALIWNKMTVRFDLERPAAPAALYHQLKIERDLSNKTTRCLSFAGIAHLPLLEKTNYKQLLKIVDKEKDRLVDAPLLQFAENNILEGVKIILQSKSITPINRSNAAGTAYRSTCPPQALEMLLNSGPLPEDDRGAILIGAASSRNLANVRVILASGSIQIGILGKAIKCSIAYYNERPHLFEIVQAILAKGPISDAHRREAIALIRKKGLPDMVKLLPLLS